MFIHRLTYVHADYIQKTQKRMHLFIYGNNYKASFYCCLYSLKTLLPGCLRSCCCSLSIRDRSSHVGVCLYVIGHVVLAEALSHACIYDALLSAELQDQKSSH